ncbi:putative bifunctional diguanylate cyclase/phosphodiesterase [Inconstantimicrobium mannanitabidum]|uniref:Uncharacterized protein n=1 Tax=Inconstantimicrobium mannanitabidum TaxID=1604901 RepID=A0ACB5RCK4_9CLOT|nr:bifunctional diguanylate cyclase/phosphodiesterase [Clostridium sp. TW13]GKX66990.1 hypothetical protein rsdtw13_22480 [Clostridium sp. TW13]
MDILNLRIIDAILLISIMINVVLFAIVLIMLKNSKVLNKNNQDNNVPVKFCDSVEKVDSLISLEERYKKNSEFLLSSINSFSIEVSCLDRTIRFNESVPQFFVDHVEDNTISFDNFMNLVVEEDKDKLRSIYMSLEKLEKIDSGIEFRIKSNNQVFWLKFSLNINHSVDADRNNIFGVLSDNSELKEKENKIIYMDYYDTATSLYNKKYLKKCIVEYIQQNENTTAGIIFVDLDNFKYINDTFGHDYGDDLLKNVAKELKKVINKSNLLSRFGGDEFVVFLPEINNILEVEKLAERIMRMFNDNHMRVSDDMMPLTASMGLALYPSDGSDYKVLLRNADAALNRAKNSGKNRYQIFNNEIYNEMKREYEIEKELTKALERNELYVEFQPKVGLSEKRIIGFEALIRWESAKLGKVSPVEFIPVAEYSRLIVPIGRFVIEETVKKCYELIQHGYDDFNIALNLSEIQLRDSEIVNDFINITNMYGVSPKYVEIEITESLLMKSIDKNIEILVKLKELGFSIVLDDFGTGYSSLNYLTRLPIDVLKIDRSFVNDILESTKSRCIVEKIIELSHNLGIKVVAEGVEEKDQVEYLRSILCDFVQGYYYSKPISFQKAVALMDSLSI